MIYRAIGVFIQNNEVSISFTEFHENAGSWSYELKAFSVFIAGKNNPGFQVNKFILENNLQFQVALVSVFAAADLLVNGAAIAAETELPVISGLNELDIALGGNGDIFSLAATKLGLTNQALSNEHKSISVALMGILRWREEYNFLSSITGASRDSIGGAIWLGMGG